MSATRVNDRDLLLQTLSLISLNNVVPFIAVRDDQVKYFVPFNFGGLNRWYSSNVSTSDASFKICYEAHALPIAKEALERIAALYGIEREIRVRPPMNGDRSDKLESIVVEAFPKVRRDSGDPLRARTLDAIAPVLQERKSI